MLNRTMNWRTGTGWPFFPSWEAGSMGEMISFLKECVEGDLIPWVAQVAAAERFGVSLAQVESSILALRSARFAQASCSRAPPPREK